MTEPKFKIGDRVRRVKVCCPFPRWAPVGAEGVVQSFDDEYPLVVFPGVGSPALMYPDEIELIDEPPRPDPAAPTIDHAEEMAKALADLLNAYSGPDESMCCSDRDCGCQGYSVWDKAEHYARAALAAYRASKGGDA